MTRADGFGAADRPGQEGGQVAPSWATRGGAPAAPTSPPAPATPLVSTAAEPVPVDPPAGEPAVGRPDPDARPAADPLWAKLVLTAILALTALGYLWNIDRNGWANSFYAAAVQAGTHSWTSFFYGSFDWGDYITVDKPPVSLWIMALAGRIFGFSSWSMLAPQALLGVGAVALLHASVRRAWGTSAGLIAAALLALTPAAALMFRFNNPDAALTFLLVAAAYTLTRAVERSGTAWLLATAGLLGTAFLAKSLQAVLVVPGLATAYLWCAPARLVRRIGQLLVAGLVMLASGLWWPLLVDAIPAGSRPYIGGSTTNSVLELILGYNGLGRITGQEGGPGGGAAGAGGPGRPGGGFGFGGATGWDRMINNEFGGFIAWWIPAAIVGALAAVWLLRAHPAGGTPRTDPRLASLVVWSGWTLVTAVVFSFASGIIHSYYTVALAPGVAALAAAPLPALWRRRVEPVARAFLAASAGSTALAAFLLLGRAPGWVPWLRWTVLAVGLVAAVLMIPRPIIPAGRAGGSLVAVAGVAAVVAGTAGPFAWSAATIASTQTGSLPTVGPAHALRSSDDPARLPGGPGRTGVPGVRAGSGIPGGTPSGGVPGGVPGGLPAGGAVVGRGAFGGPGGAAEVSDELVALLKAGASGYRWVAAAQSSMVAGPLQLSVDAPVMSLGGFGGRDDAITLERFRALVAERKVHYYVTGGQGDQGIGAGGRTSRQSGGQVGPPGSPGSPGSAGPGGEATSAIAVWVSSTFVARTVDATTVYDLTTPA